MVKGQDLEYRKLGKKENKNENEGWELGMNDSVRQDTGSKNEKMTRMKDLRWFINYDV